MLIHTNFRAIFYEVIKQKHTLIIVNPDVDALCACIILTYALSCDDATFSLCPVNSFLNVQKVVEEHKDQICNLVLINCGGSQSLLNLPNNIKTFVIDSHRPVHLDNIYSSDLFINVLVHSSDFQDWNIPESSLIYENSFDDNDKENCSNDENDENGDSCDIASIVEQRALKKQQKANWKRNRATLLHNYYINSYYSTSSAVFMLELLNELGKLDSKMMWCGAVGLTSQITDQLISIESYTNVCLDRMRSFIKKFAPKKPIEETRGDGVLRITFNKELILPLYAHWSLYCSMRHDPMFFCQSKLWTQKGEANLKYILAKLGLTLAECRQDFSAMNLNRRTEVFEILEKYMDTSFATFNACFAYSTRYNSADFARALSLFLECKSYGKQKLLYERFAAAKSLMHRFLNFGGRETPELNKIFNKYKIALEELTSLVFSSINQKNIVSTPRFFKLNLEQGSFIGYLSSRHCLNYFSYSLLKAFASAKKPQRTSKPFIISVPMSSLEEKNALKKSNNLNSTINEPNSNFASNLELWYLVVGIMSLADVLSDTQRKSVMGQIFKRVAKEIKVDIEYEGFELNMIKIRADDYTKFFNSLEAQLDIV